MIWTQSFTRFVICQREKLKKLPLCLYFTCGPHNGRTTSPGLRTSYERLQIYLLCYRLVVYRERLFSFSTNQCACFSTKTANNKLKQKSKKENTMKNDKMFDVQGGALVSYDEIKTSLRCSRKKNKQSYVFEQSVAEKIVAAVMRRRENPSSPVLEIQAGPGLVSREFLKQGVTKVVALEMNKDFSSFLMTLQNNVGSEKFQFFIWHMVNLYLKLHGSPHESSVLTFQKMESEVAGSLMHTKVSSEVPYSLLSVGGTEDNESFVFYVLRNLPHEDPILSHGRVEFFFLAHPRFVSKINCISNMKKLDAGVASIFRGKVEGTQVTYMQIMIYLFYDMEVLEEFDADDFYPPFSAHKSSQPSMNIEIDSSKRFLTKMQLKKNIDEILPVRQHTAFMNFLCQVYKKKSRRLVPSMEMLIPGCGLRMLALGFTMMDTVATSRPEEFLKLYKMMLEWPEYISSPLHNYLLMKEMGSTESDTVMDADVHQ